MAKRKKINQKSKMDKARLLDDITTAKPGEFCYFIDRWRKIWWGQIEKVIEENNQLLFQIIEEKESKYYVIPSTRCAFSEKIIKEIKSGQ